MTKQKWFNIIVVLLAVGALALGVFAVNRADAPVPRGATHFGSIATNGTLAVVGAADAEQLAVTGYSTQTNSLLVLQQSDGTDTLTVSDAGALMVADNVDVRGNILDGGGEVNILGYGQVTGNTDHDQWTVTGYTTQTKDLLVLEASGGADQFTVSNDGNADVAGTLQYGDDDLYPLGYASSGQQAIYGTASITGTAVAAHGLTTVTFALCTLGEDPETGTGDAAFCTLTVSSNTVTLKAWQDDWASAATETDVAVHWLVIGTP